MERNAQHFVRHAVVVGACYVALIVVAWILVGFGAAVIAAVGAGALIALGLPLVIIREEEEELSHPHHRAPR